MAGTICLGDVRRWYMVLVGSVNTCTQQEMVHRGRDLQEWNVIIIMDTGLRNVSI